MVRLVGVALYFFKYGIIDMLDGYVKIILKNKWVFNCVN